MIKAQKDFIEMIGNAAVAAYPQYRILPSLTIAQTILESNWGKSGLSKDCYNYFGMKWKEGCGCDYKEYNTKEQKPTGEYYTIKAKFRKYKDAADGIRGDYKFLAGYARYKNLIGVTDSAKACDLIRQDGWATSLGYSTNLKKYVATYNLTEWDKKAGVSVVVNTSPAFSVGTYVVTATAIKVRTGPGTSYPQRAFTDMTLSAQKLNEEHRKDGRAVYGKGTRFTAQSITKVSSKEIWAKTPSGYVALMYNRTEYVEKC